MDPTGFRDLLEGDRFSPPAHHRFVDRGGVDNSSPLEALLDPMCGSGTLLIEAALIALNMAPGARRSFAFEKLKNFDARQWDRLRLAAKTQESPRGGALPIYGADLYGDELKNSRENIAAAGLTDQIQLKQANVLEIPAPAATGVIVTNPP